MSTRLHIVVSEELAAEIDAARGIASRSAWLRMAIVRALQHAASERGALAAAKAIVAKPDKFSAATVETARGAVERALGDETRDVATDRGRSPAPAEQLGVAIPAERWRAAQSSSLSKRDVQPIPKAKP